MKKVCMIAFLIALSSATIASAANTVNSEGQTAIQVSAMDSDFDLVATTGYTHYANGAPLGAILFYPGAANDVLVVKNQSDSGPIVAKLKSLDGEPRVQYLHGLRLKPYIDYSDCTLSSGAFAVFFIEIK